MIDVTKKDSKASRSSIMPLMVIIVALVLGYLYWGQDQDEANLLGDVPDAMVVLDAEGMASSTLLDQWAKDQNLELRRVSSSSQLTNAESWVKLLADEGKSRSPCVVVCKDGEITIIPITDNLIDAVDSLSADD
jgi:hypothetical protein